MRYDIESTVRIVYALIHQVAGAYKVSTEHKKNCYTDDVNWLDHPYWCNTGDLVSVHEDKWNSLMEVRLRFNGKTEGGRFDCVAVKEAAVGFLVNEVAGDFEKALDTERLGAEIECMNEVVT